MRNLLAAVSLLLCASGAAVSATKPFRVADCGLHQFEDGPKVPANYEAVAGEVLFVRCEGSGYQIAADKKVKLSYTVEAIDSEGTPIVEMASEKINETLSNEDKDWKPPMRATVNVPPHADPGAYSVRIRAKDELANVAAAADLSFRVRGRMVEPSPTLALRNFGFLRGENDEVPLATPAYRPGDPLWARFDITGYKLGAKNAFDVSYGVSIIAPSGKVLFSQPVAASEKGDTFYRRRFVSATMSLNLDAKVTPGSYTLVLISEDRIGAQKIEEKRTFQVE